MSSIELVIPLELTTSQIIRASPVPISENAARELALELHDLVDEAQARYARPAVPVSESELDDLAKLDDDERRARAVKRPLISDDRAAFVLADLIDAVRRTALGFWPYNNGEAVAQESRWLMEELTRIDDALYARYLRLHDRINATNFAEIATGEDHPQSPKDSHFPGSTRH